MLAVQSAELGRLYAIGEVGEDTRRRLQRYLDRQDLRYTEE
ncbi:hypothetical protein ACFWYW_28635 [Nonomuraea sp. NPDC059023]